MRDAPPLGVYVHWPYCARICPYCDFNVYKNREIDAARWSAALLHDLEYWAAQTPGRPLTSLYFGGGTPSLAPLRVIETVIGACDRLWGFEDSPEITLEANPTDAEQSLFSSFASAGVNRLSLGIQSLRDDALKFLGRNHGAQEARGAIEQARKVFGRFTFDLIYARPDQTLAAWKAELREALALGAPHMSLYQLTIEPGTAFDKAVTRGAWAPPDDDAGADFFDATQEICAAAGLPAYETSNHARPGHQSRHNMIYWRQDDYIGIGPGAHGRLTINGERLASQNHLAPETYLGAVEKPGEKLGEKPSAGASLVETLNEHAQLTERLSMGLRLTDGIPLYADDYFYADEARVSNLERLMNEGFLSHNCGILRTTPRGRPLLNRLLYELLG